MGMESQEGGRGSGSGAASCTVLGLIWLTSPIWLCLGFFVLLAPGSAVVQLTGADPSRPATVVLMVGASVGFWVGAVYLDQYLGSPVARRLRRVSQAIDRRT